MTRNTRGRSGWGSRTAHGSTGPSPSGRQTTSPRTHRTTTPNVPTKYKEVCNTFTWKINSFRTLYNQVRGPAKYDRPSPMVLNTFANWINKGAIVQTCTRTQLAKWARATNKTFGARTPSAANCKTVLDAKFGKNAIKAVARTKTGSYMVATSPMWQGKMFQFPK